MKSKVISGVGFNNQVRFYISDTTSIINEITSKLQTSPVVSAAVGRSSSITGLMGLMLKDDQSITTIIDGNGPIGKITVVADANGEIRSTVTNRIVDIPLKANKKLDVSGAVGAGSLTVIKDLKLKEPFVGKVDLVSGEIAEDYTYYFASSEQTATAISAGVLVDVDYSIKSSGVLIIQLLPDATDETIDLLEQRFMNLEQISSLLLKNTPTEIIEKVFEKDYRILDDTKTLEYKCNCSYNKYFDVLKGLPEHDKEELRKDKIIECVCNFCSEKYEIDSTLI